MSGTPAYKFRITRNGRQPTEVTVQTEDGQQLILYVRLLRKRQTNRRNATACSRRQKISNQKEGWSPWVEGTPEQSGIFIRCHNVTKDVTTNGRSTERSEKIRQIGTTKLFAKVKEADSDE